MLNGYADEHVSHAIVRSLRARGMDIASVTERGAEGRPDEVLLDEALSEARIMLTCDTDFLRLAAERHTSGIEFAPIVFWPQQQRNIGNVVRSVIQVATNYAYEDACSRVFFL